MDERRFDAWTRALGGTTSRRRVLRGALALFGAAVGPSTVEVDAARRGTSGPSVPNGPSNGLVLTLSAVSIRGLCHVLAAVAGAPPSTTAAVAISAQGGDTWVEFRQIDTDLNGSGQVLSDHHLFSESVVIGNVIVQSGDSTTVRRSLSC